MKEGGSRTIDQEAEERSRRLFDEHTHEIARAAVDHLKVHYPAALGAVPKNAEVSLRNSIKANVRARFGPLLSVMVELDKSWQ